MWPVPCAIRHSAMFWANRFCSTNPRQKIARIATERMFGRYKSSKVEKVSKIQPTANTPIQTYQRCRSCLTAVGGFRKSSIKEYRSKY